MKYFWKIHLKTFENTYKILKIKLTYNLATVFDDAYFYWVVLSLRSMPHGSCGFKLHKRYKHQNSTNSSLRAHIAFCIITSIKLPMWFYDKEKKSCGFLQAHVKYIVSGDWGLGLCECTTCTLIQNVNGRYHGSLCGFPGPGRFT